MRRDARSRHRPDDHAERDPDEHEVRRVLERRGLVDELRPLGEAQLGIVSFRREAPGVAAADLDARHLEVVARMLADGDAAVSSTVLHGFTVLRMCTINPRTTPADIDRTVAALGRAWGA